jgi:hypothetical protein
VASIIGDFDCAPGRVALTATCGGRRGRTTVPLGDRDAVLLRNKLKHVATTPSEWIEAYLQMAGAGSVTANRGARF